VVQESELVVRQADAPLGNGARLAARVVALALSPNGCKGNEIPDRKAGHAALRRMEPGREKPFVGIDVAMAALDVFIGSAERLFQ
jgi:hypothetical protein